MLRWQGHHWLFCSYWLDLTFLTDTTNRSSLSCLAITLTSWCGREVFESPRPHVMIVYWSPSNHWSFTNFTSINGKNVSNLILCSAVDRRHHILLDQSSNKVCMKLHMLHLTVQNRVSSNLYFTFIVTINYSRLHNRKSELTHQGANPHCLSAIIHCAFVINFSSWQGNNLKFLT